jgi:hypothetical protein
MTRWEPFDADRSAHVRISETSCCGAFEWVCQGGQFMVLRHTERGYEETGRGIYPQARRVWTALVDAHKKDEHGNPITWLPPDGTAAVGQLTWCW